MTDAEELAALKACPFCGDDSYCGLMKNNMGFHLVECGACGTQGIDCDSKSEAVAFWNCRSKEEYALWQKKDFNPAPPDPLELLAATREYLLTIQLRDRVDYALAHRAEMKK